MANYWVKCRSCGAPVGIYEDGYESVGGRLAPGSVAHTKPVSKIGIPGTGCALFDRLSAEEFTTLHRDAERIAAPESMTPVLG